MSDRELMEAAAKAAGSEFVNLLSHGKWNPLVDDGLALRLAVKLNITIVQPEGDDLKEVGAWTGSHYKWVEHGVDPYAATRRAIVRAAAALAKAM